MYHFIFFPKNLQRGCKILYLCKRQAALGKTKRVEKVSDDADAMLHSPGPQARAPSLWEGRGRFLEGQAGFLGGPGVSVPACNMAYIGLQHGSFHRAK